MAFLGSGTTLEDALGQQAQSSINDIQTQYAKKRRQSVAQQAAAGRLGSGVSNYQAGDINAAQAGDIGGVESALSSALAEIPEQDYASQQDYKRQLALATLIGKLNKGGGLLSGILGGAGSGAAAGGSIGGPWGALIGGVGGGIAGGFAADQ